jgi:hypothetical protein
MSLDDGDHAIIQAYKDRFGDVPTLVGLGEDDYQIALGALEDALESGKPWGSDAEFYRAIGLEPPPDDAEI